MLLLDTKVVLICHNLSEIGFDPSHRVVFISEKPFRHLRHYVVSIGRLSFLKQVFGLANDCLKVIGHAHLVYDKVLLVSIEVGKHIWTDLLLTFAFVEDSEHLLEDWT